MFWCKNKLKPKEDFYTKIENHFNSISNENIPKNILKELYHVITINIYNDYSIKWNDYPKSRKRYSKLKISDLDHPYIQNDIIVFLKNKDLKKYKFYSSILLNITEEEISEFEIRREKYESYF